MKYLDDILEKEKNYPCIINYHNYLKNSNLDIYERCVFDILRVYADDKNYCSISQGTIAGILNLCRTKVNRTLKSLESKGAILIINKQTDIKRRTINTYIIANINPYTGEFIASSLDKYRKLSEEVQIVREDIIDKKY